MSRPLSIPYIIYWLLVKDFFYNVDVCDTTNNEPGHCLSNSECSTIGTNIGSCDSGTSDNVCCKITFNFFNETYLLKQIFVRKSQTDVMREMVLFSSATPCGESLLQYGNGSISLKKKEKVYYVPKIHISETPDKIIWPIWASYSRESRDLKKQSFGTNHLYVVELNRLVADDRDNKSHPVSECVSESDEDNKFYIFLNPEKRFPIRNFFTTKMQKQNTMNLTIARPSSIEVDTEKRSRRSVQVEMDNPEHFSCEKKQLDDLLNVKDLKELSDIQSELEMSDDFFEKRDNSDDNLINNKNSVINYVLKPKAVSTERMEHEDIEELSSDKEDGDKIEPNKPVFNEKISDSNINSKDLSEERTVRFQEIKITTKGRTNYNLNRPSVYNIRSQESKITYNFRQPVKVETTHNMRMPVQLDDTHDLRTPVQLDSSHDMRTPVKVEPTHDMRKPVEKESSHDMRKAVENNVDHDKRKPAKTGRVPVQREGTHDMRKPVTSDESHDLRWPVLEVENDLRNVYRENDADEIDVNLMPQNSSLDCNSFISLFSMKRASSENESGENKKKQLNDVWEEASRVCGKYFGNTTESSSSKIPENWPWMVSLHENISGKYKHKCSAALLNNLWAVTVAHCVDMKPKANILLLGKRNSIDGKENLIEIAVDEIVIHPRFNRGLFENDLALLRMKTPVKFQSAQSPICLPWNVEKLTQGIPVYLGWKLKDQRTTDDLQSLAVPIMTNYECEILYSTGRNKEKIKDTFLCAGKEDGNCDNESGSSLITLDSEGRWSLIGLVSWGSMCTNTEKPAVYIRVSSYVPWIKDVIDCYEILM